MPNTTEYNREYMRQYRAANRALGIVTASQLGARARGRALERLVLAHPEEFKQLKKEERVKLNNSHGGKE